MYNSVIRRTNLYVLIIMKLSPSVCGNAQNVYSNQYTMWTSLYLQWQGCKTAGNCRYEMYVPSKQSWPWQSCLKKLSQRYHIDSDWNYYTMSCTVNTEMPLQHDRRVKRFFAYWNVSLRNKSTAGFSFSLSSKFTIQRKLEPIGR